MKKLILFITMIAAINLHSDDSDIYDEDWPMLCPLWEAEGKMAYYRVLLIESSIFTIEKLVEQLKNNPCNAESSFHEIEQELSACKYNLGLSK